MFVATKIILEAAPANDTFGVLVCSHETSVAGQTDHQRDGTVQEAKCGPFGILIVFLPTSANGEEGEEFLPCAKCYLPGSFTFN